MARLGITGKWWVLALTVLSLLIICAARVLGPDRAEETEPPLGPVIAVLGRDGNIFRLPLEDLLIGVVAAEMPAAFHEEALAAQAVAARTYILAALAEGGRHREAVVCCDPGCCQAWRDPLELEEAAREKVTRAVRSTAGRALYYEGRLAQALFCSCCGGRTESAADCFGGDCPWLVSVDCGFCGHAPRLCSCAVFGLSEAASLLECGEEELRAMELTGYTSGGRVAGVMLGDRCLSGREVRGALGLNSAAFTWLIQGDRLLVATLGFGHGVGLCQYGADGMARAGYAHGEILAHYYPGCGLQQAY